MAAALCKCSITHQDGCTLIWVNFVVCKVCCYKAVLKQDVLQSGMHITKGTKEKAAIFITRTTENIAMFQDPRCYGWVSTSLLRKSWNIKISSETKLI